MELHVVVMVLEGPLHLLAPGAAMSALDEPLLSHPIHVLHLLVCDGIVLPAVPHELLLLGRLVTFLRNPR
eukprot:2044421-Pyramimonas_sp.AAC.1